MNRLPGRWWAVATSAALVAGAAWLRTDSAVTLAVAAASGIAAAVMAWRGRRGAVTSLSAIALVAFSAVAAVDWRAQVTFAAHSAAARAALESDATKVMAARIASEAEQLRALAVRALDAPTDAAAAFTALDRLRGSHTDRAVAVARGGLLAAWSGHYTAPVDSLPGPVGVVANGFYLTLYAIAGRDRDRAVATTLLHAEPPASALADEYDDNVADDLGVASFVYGRPDAAGDSAAVVSAAGVPVVTVRAVAPGAAEIEQRNAQRARERGTLILALGLVLFLSATWRGGSVRARFAALGVTLAMLALLPFADLSNRTALFNPAFYFIAAGGPMTGSIGALALTSATVLVGVLATQRAQLFPRVRWQAAAVVVVVATLGPFVVSNVTQGIKFPSAGAPALLWLAWETTVFLSAVVVLYAGIAAGEAAVGSRRGIPLWFPPLFAAGAAAVAPAVVAPAGGLPQWYTVLWALAIVAMALARHGRGSLWAAATVAAFGSTALVWSETVKARVQLAEQDVGSLGAPDPVATALVRRFPLQLDSLSAPRTRVELVARFARSDLANSDLPVDVTTWTPGGERVMADLRVGMGLGSARGIEFFARDAADKMRPVLTNTPSEPGTLTVLAIPHADRTVTTVVVAPRTRLVPPDPFPTIGGMGRSRDAGAEPPYTLQEVPAAMSQFISTEAQWTRQTEELHGDWFLPPTGGPVRHVHARVPLNGYWPLAARGGLMVCVNLGVLGFLWVLLVVADGGAFRWLRTHGGVWLRSYRARLTVSLFAAFVLPAAAFASWSYSRLREEDSESRDLLVRETLRAVSVAPSAGLDSLAARFETPLFLYANNVLLKTSDPVFDALAPIGRLLPSAAARTLIANDEGFAATELSVGGTPIRFGFRAVVDTSFPGSLVLVAPARTAELRLDQRRRDLAFFVLFASVVGALGALWVSGVAGREFARPIGELQKGALALAAGEREPLLAGEPPPEFEPVFHAFRQMARDLEAGRARDARAQRVLAWGEMARQVAHEIKNPLTPMRLGVQHLQRAKDDPRVDFRQVFDDNAARLLQEIDRLDEIARAFSRYGTAPDAQPAPERVDVSEAVRDVVRLERLGADGVSWEMDGVDAPTFAMARPTELREVLLNVLENARLADAKRVVVAVSNGDRTVLTVRDDGHGIAVEAISRVFEPHFSTRTSGSGLGLAISRRLIDGWGGSIGIESVPGSGTTLTISLVPAPTP